MNRRTLFAISLAVASTFASEAVYAAPASIHPPMHAMFAKSKLVKFAVRNDGTAPITLKVGEDTMTLDAGTTRQLELPVGTRILRETGNATQQPGALVTEVSKELSGSTLALRS